MFADLDQLLREIARDCMDWHENIWPELLMRSLEVTRCNPVEQKSSCPGTRNPVCPQRTLVFLDPLVFGQHILWLVLWIPGSLRLVAAAAAGVHFVQRCVGFFVAQSEVAWDIEQLNDSGYYS